MTFTRSLFNVFKYLLCILITYTMLVWLQGQTFTQMVSVKYLSRSTALASFLTVSSYWYIIGRSKIHGLRLLIILLLLTALFLPGTELLLKSAVNNNLTDTLRTYLGRTSLPGWLVYLLFPLVIFILTAGWKKKNFRESFYYISHIGFFSYIFRFLMSFMIFPLVLGLISLFSPSKIISLSFIVRPSFMLSLGIQNLSALITYFILIKTGRGQPGERILLYSILLSLLMLYHTESGNNWIIVVAAAQFLSFLTAGPILLTYRRKSHY